MAEVHAACHAMATRFELVLHGENSTALRAAADQACHEIERLHAQLSLYLTSSEVSFINAHAAHRPVKVEPGLFGLLQLAQRVHSQTHGAFDITVAPLIRCWGFMGGTGAIPTPGELAQARSRVGLEHVLLDEKRFTIQFAREGMMIDLGSIGKGYALEVASEALVEAGVQSALIHGGTSTVCAIGRPPHAEAWKVAIPTPPRIPSSGPASVPNLSEQTTAAPLAVVSLKDEALSVSGVHGKYFQAEGKVYGHVMDPRTGSPAQGALLAAVVLPSAAETDAFSTALLLAGIPGHDSVATLRPNMRTLVVEEDCGQFRVASKGMAVESIDLYGSHGVQSRSKPVGPPSNPA